MVRDLERYRSLADHGSGSETVPSNLRAHEEINVAEKLQEITVLYAMAIVKAGEVRGDLATCTSSGQRRSKANTGVSPHLWRGLWPEGREHQLEMVKTSSWLQAIELLPALWALPPNVPSTAAR